MSKKMLTTGAFAKLCKTTKETIFHYDRENILKPRYEASNGYRYYSLDQLWDFESIATLKDIGSSLREIRYYLKDTEPERLLSFLREKDSALDEEIERLLQRKLFLSDMLSSLQELSQSSLDTVSFARQEETLLEVWPIDPSAARSASALWETFYDYLGSYRERNRMARWPFGTILEWEGPKTANCAEEGRQGASSARYFFGLAKDAEGSAKNACGQPGPLSLLAQDAGLYAILFHKGNHAEQERAIASFLSFLEGKGLSHDKHVFCTDMLAYARRGDETAYVNRYSVRLLVDASDLAGKALPLEPEQE